MQVRGPAIYKTLLSSEARSAVIARKLVDQSKDSIGTMATIYPSDDPVLPGVPLSQTF